MCRWCLEQQALADADYQQRHPGWTPPQRAGATVLTDDLLTPSPQVVALLAEDAGRRAEQAGYQAARDLFGARAIPPKSLPPLPPTSLAEEDWSMVDPAFRPSPEELRNRAIDHQVQRDLQDLYGGER